MGVIQVGLNLGEFMSMWYKMQCFSRGRLRIKLVFFQKKTSECKCHKEKWGVLKLCFKTLNLGDVRLSGFLKPEEGRHLVAKHPPSLP